MLKKVLRIAIFPFLVLLVAFNIKTIQPKVVVINAAHGGDDFGVTYDSIKEKELVLEIAKNLKSYTNANVKFVILRDTDVYVPLNERIAKVDSIHPDVVITLHLSQDPDVRKSGMVVSVGKNGSIKESSEYGEKILKRLQNESFKVTDSLLISDTYFINNINKTPAVLLELGFLSNEKDREALVLNSTKKKIAKAISKAL